MSTETLPHDYRIVVFDLGGVLAQICHTWESAAAQGGVATRLAADGATPLISQPFLDDYQKGAIDLDTYLDLLAEWSGADRAQVLHVHNGILVEQYPDVEDLVREIEAAGMATGCLSNTNAPHWEVLTGDQYPSIKRLTHKMASHLVGLNKPDPEIFLRYADTFGFSPSQVIFFDDHPGNVQSAGEVGFRAFRIDPTQPTAPQIRAFLVETGVLPA